MRAKGWLNSRTAVATPRAEDPDARGVTCSRVAFVTLTATLQQGARSSAVPLSSPALAQHASESEEPHHSAARAGRAVEPIRTLTAIAAATRRIEGILLGFPFHDNPNGESMMRTPYVHGQVDPLATVAPLMDAPAFRGPQRQTSARAEASARARTRQATCMHARTFLGLLKHRFVVRPNHSW